jgi:hypothetical protein
MVYMNKRIRELVKQATLSGHMLGESYVQSRLDEQKFAELIVLECAQLARDTNLEDVEGGDSAVLRAAKRQILEHFGVKE